MGLLYAVFLFFAWISTFECIKPVGFIPVAYQSPNSVLQPNGRLVAVAKKSPSAAFLDNVKKCLKLYQRGLVDLPKHFQHARELWLKQRKHKSELVLSYSERKQLEKAKGDFFSLLKFAFFVKITPEYSLYSYVIIPLLSYQNPWSFKDFPSTFVDSTHQEKIEKSLEQRKVQAVVKGFESLQDDRVADHPEGNIEMRNEHLQLIDKVLKQRSSLEKGMEVLEPMLLVPKNHPKKLRAKHIPHIAIRESIRGLIDNGGFPNIPLIRRFNIGMLEGYLNQLEKEDTFLVKKGLNALNNDEVKLACNERGILVDKKDPKLLRQQLQEWLSISTKADASSGLAHAAKMKVNPLERRLALIGLSIVRDLPQNEFAQPYQMLLQK